MNIYSPKRIVVLRSVRLPEGVVPLHTEAAGTEPPDAFGPFRVLHQVGAGTLGPVFRAYDADRARLVAVKVLRLDVPPERLHQLVTELERVIAAGLTHPVVAAPIATGTDGLVMYLAQEYVPADSLDVVLRDEGPPVPADALRVAAQLAGALDFAADRQVHHGVLHPRDVLISPEDTRLTGLGVAGAIEKIGVAAPRRRPYTAPERMAGAAWDRRADVFSLAALIHEMLWGRRLTAIGAEAAGALTSLPGADLARLKSAFARALAPDPADRFESAMDFANALGDAFPRRVVAGAERGHHTAPPRDRRNVLEDRSLHQPGDLLNGKAGDPAADGLQTGAGNVLQTVPEHDLHSDDLELRAAGDARADEAELEPTMAWEPAAHAAGPGVDPAPQVAPVEERTLMLRNGLEGRSLHQSGDLLHGLDGDPAADDFQTREGRGLQTVPDHDLHAGDLELFPPEDARSVQPELEPTIAWEPSGHAARPGVASAQQAAPLEERTLPLRNGPEGRALHQSDSPEDLETVPESDVPDRQTLRQSPPRSSLFQPSEVDPPERFDVRDGSDEHAPSLLRPVAAALIVGLALGFAGGYVLGGRHGTPSVASSPPAAAPSRSTAAAARPAREFTEAAVSESNAAGLKPESTAKPETTGTPDAGKKGTPGATPASVTAPGRLLVRSTPAGARVFVDDRELGQTPATIMELARGTHRVRLVRVGYVAEERRIAITAAQPSAAIAIELTRSSAPAAARRAGSPARATAGASVGALTVDSRPAGASVFLDGQPVGVTPLSLPQIAEGEHGIRLERDGYRRWSSSIRVAGGQRQRVAASLDR